MSRIQEKVKDLIEVCEYESLLDFQSEPSKTLSSYHFTDVTSELMAQWLDTIAGTHSESGAAKALAGYRGVGKSHFLAAFAAILAHPELRSRLTDSHVSTSAQVLMRRPYPVAYARRGTEGSLLEEIRVGISLVFSLELSDIPKNIVEILNLIKANTADIPFALIIDTALERDSRVSRDDGVVLGELAELAKGQNIFIGVALDDDITDADGINLAISRTFTIDYLDQEHLNKIVNTHIFPKNRQSQSYLSNTYKYFREVLPGFRWSEKTFSSLYPLHPSILELAQFVRLYAPHFALLGFASEAGSRILGRPANSLIALDEVFDNVEHSLRKAVDLKEVFEVYDKINQEIVTQIPVMQRLQAKLILKALLILSLDGDGTTATEIAATMLIYNESDPQKAIENVEELLEKFTSVFPDDLQRKVSEGQETQYSLKVSSKDKLNDALESAIKEIPLEIVPQVLRRVANDKFSDWNLSAENDDETNIWTDCHITWRGGQRRCRLYWNWDNEAYETLKTVENADYLDLEIFINNPQSQNFEDINNQEILRAIWQPAELSQNEIETILRFHVLLNDESLRLEFGEQIRAAGHKHIIEIEKIWHRVFFDEAHILHESEAYEFNQIEVNKETLGEILSNNLQTLFENEYPEHPVFEDTLGMVQVSKLVNDLFSGARKTHEGVQTIAETFALPLGLVSKRGENYVLETEETLFRLPLVEKILTLISQSDNSTVLLKTIYKRLKEKPYGLIREAQHLILSALVAQRKIEFVTTNGDRINRRSLDLKIIWDDIAGIAKPASVIFGAQKLTDWAKILTELKDVQTIDVAEDRNQVKESLKKWLVDWQDAQILERFNLLPDEILNTKIWYISVNIEKSFGSVANSLNNFFDESISLEICLQRIADAFSDSVEEFNTRKDELITLYSFVSSADNRQKVWNYLAVCEKTENVEIEFLREKLFVLLDLSASAPDSETNVEVESLWNNFQNLFNEHFAINHNTMMKSHHLQEKFDEIVKSDPWWEFSNLSRFPIFHQKYWMEAQKLIKRFNELDCQYNVREMLKSHPFCGCSFNLAKMKDWEDLPKSLVRTIEQGRKSYRRTMALLNDTLIQLLETYIKNEIDNELKTSAKELLDQFVNKTEIKKFTTDQLVILHNLLHSLTSLPTIDIKYPQNSNVLNTVELRQNMNQWLDELPAEKVYLKVK